MPHIVRFPSSHPFSQALLARIEQLDVSLGVVARCSGISKTRISELIRTPVPNPQIGTVLRLATTLDISAAVLLSTFLKDIK